MSFTAVHFGAGNIGRGFLGQLYWESGFAIHFVDAKPDLVEALHRRGEYPLRIVSEAIRDLRITGVDAVSASNTGSIADLMLHAEIVSTAVGANVLPALGPAIARGLEKRYSRTNAPPLNILICENLADGDRVLREAVFANLSGDFTDVVDARVGFVRASVGRMVPLMTPEQRAEDPLLVCVEPYRELPVDRDAIKGLIPPIKHVTARPNFDGYIARKLFVHNLSHAAVAYLGFLRGFQYIWEAAEDKGIRNQVDACMEESIQAIHQKYGLGVIDLQEHAEDLLERYTNRALGDTVARVARDPIRKLGPSDRIVGAGTFCNEQGVDAQAIALVAAAAMRFYHPEDPAALELQRIRAESGAEGVIREVCKLPLDSAFAKAILNAERRLDAFLT